MIPSIEQILSYLASWLYILSGCNHTQTLVGINGTQNHTLTLDTHHRTRGEVGHKEDALTNELLRILIEGCDT